MTPYAIRAGLLPTDKIDLFRRLVEDFEAMPDLQPSNRASCHAVCRALEKRHPTATCVDGFFQAVGNEHSWLDLGDGVVADMYPIAASNPILVEIGHWLSPWHKLYMPRHGMLDDGTRRITRADHEAVAAELVAALEEHDRQP